MTPGSGVSGNYQTTNRLGVHAMLEPVGAILPSLLLSVLVLLPTRAR
jgi:hypothetical protein